MILFHSVLFSVARCSLSGFVGLSSLYLLLFNDVTFGLPFFLHSSLQWLKYKIRGETGHSGLGPCQWPFAFSCRLFEGKKAYIKRMIG